MTDVGLTPEELAILDLLADAWNRWCDIPERHPDDIKEFRHAIHAAQHLVALQVARRANPEVWR